MDPSSSHSPVSTFGIPELFSFPRDNGKEAHRLVWATDIHLDHMKKKPNEVEDFIKSITHLNPDLLVLTGDIDMGFDVITTIKKIAELVNCKVFFVLGNHDFYGSSIASVRQEAIEFTHEQSNALYLHNAGIVELNQSTVLIGTDGWADGCAGDIIKSHFALNDFVYINELKVSSAEEIHTKEMKERLISFAKPSIDYIEEILPKIFQDYQKAILATHVPPFWEASYFKGKQSDESSAPFFVSKSLGDKLLEVMKVFPEKELIVICGHTHHEREYHPLPNLKVVVGAAEYGKPKAQNLIKIDQSESILSKLFKRFLK